MNTQGATPDTLLIVARYPEPGQVKTRLGVLIGHEKAAALYTAFLRDLAARFSAENRRWTVRWAVAPGSRPPEALRAFVGAEANVMSQRGADFADRLYAICEDARSLGARRIAIMSSDAPHLPTSLVTQAFAALPDGMSPQGAAGANAGAHGADIAIGPADDGGYSLIALHLPEPPAATPDLFRGIRMSTPTVLAETEARAARLGLRVKRLATTFDVDEAADLPRLWFALRKAPWLAPHTYATLARMAIASSQNIVNISGNEDTHGDIASNW